jgi:hypothetical protein
MNSLQQEIESLDKAISKVREQLNPLLEQRSKLIDKLKQETIESIGELTIEKIVAAPFIETFDSQEGYIKLQKFMRKFKYIGQHGYNVHTNRASFCFLFDQKEDIKPQISEALDLISHLPLVDVNLPVHNSSGRKVNEEVTKRKMVRIMEERLSRSGIYYLMIDEKSVSTIYCQYYGSLDMVKAFSSVEESLKYIHEHLPFLSTQSESDEYEED